MALTLTDADLTCIYRERSTGLHGCVVYVSPRNSSHGPLVKVLESAMGRGMEYDAAISVEAEPRWLEGEDAISLWLRSRVEQWVRNNREALLQFWNGEINDCVELAEKFVKREARAHTVEEMDEAIAQAMRDKHGRER